MENSNTIKKVKYRPYNSIEEFLKAQKEHGPGIIILSTLFVPTSIKESKIKIRGTWVSYFILLDDRFHKWQDGTICGVLEKN